MEAEERFDENKDTTESINNDNKVEEASQKDNNSEQLEKQAIDVTETEKLGDAEATPMDVDEDEPIEMDKQVHAIEEAPPVTDETSMSSEPTQNPLDNNEISVEEEETSQVENAETLKHDVPSETGQSDNPESSKDIEEENKEIEETTSAEVNLQTQSTDQNQDELMDESDRNVENIVQDVDNPVHDLSDDVQETLNLDKNIDDMDNTVQNVDIPSQDKAVQDVDTTSQDKTIQDVDSASQDKTIQDIDSASQDKEIQLVDSVTQDKEIQLVDSASQDKEIQLVDITDHENDNLDQDKTVQDLDNTSQDKTIADIDLMCHDTIPSIDISNEDQDVVATSQDKSVQNIDISNDDAIIHDVDALSQDVLYVGASQDTTDNTTTGKQTETITDEVMEIEDTQIVNEIQIDSGVQGLIENVDVQLNVVSSDDQYVVTTCNDGNPKQCYLCKLLAQPKYKSTYQKETSFLCSDTCYEGFKAKHPNNYLKRELRVKVFSPQEMSVAPVTHSSFDLIRRCKECTLRMKENDINVAWEGMEFCNEMCLVRYQKNMSSTCFKCKVLVPDATLGKYCVRFGTSLKQFCCTKCLELCKKELILCQFCQEDIKTLPKVFGSFCSMLCYRKFKKIEPAKEIGKCSVCLTEKPIEVEYVTNDVTSIFCGEPCFVAYKFVNNVVPGQCETCCKYVPKEVLTEFSIYYAGFHLFCSAKCKSIYIVVNRKIVLCFWCKVKKYNYDMVEQCGPKGQGISMCSVNCLKIFQISIKAVNSRKSPCDNCRKFLKAMYHLTMTDSSIRHFCSYPCLLTYQAGQPNLLINSAATRRLSLKKTDDIPIKMPVISHVASLANTDGQMNGIASTAPPPPKPEPEKIYKHSIFVKPTPIPDQRNIATMAKPIMVSKGCETTTEQCDQGTQTDEEKKAIIPIPVPIFVPVPLHMYTQYVPFPCPFVLPVPVPIFIPTTRNSAKGIMKEINTIKTKVPNDPLEAELLMMAELVAEDKKPESDSSSDEELDTTEPPEEPDKPEPPIPEPVAKAPVYVDDVLMMALKMATDDEPVDLEGAVSASTISVPSQDHSSSNSAPTKRKRPYTRRKKAEKQPEATEIPPIITPVSMEKPDANMCLKYTFGVNAWKQWVTTKNAELEKSNRTVKLFKTEILQLTADELNFSLCLFVKEVRKPNGSEYAPDTIYYLCLGIQQYLYVSGRIDNIFCDAFYEKFTECLNDVCRKFSVLYNDSQYIVTRVEEEHLWESKQLGAHSPLVLINTLMFFNTKHFSLTSVDEHLQLSFSHIMKHWKRNTSQPGARNVLLRFYPPQVSGESRKKKMYEQQENEENPLRCPVKLYEFYLSKCPESVKTRNDVFYLLPERSCVPDSPLWYSTMALEKQTLDKMLNRVKMVKEINIALLTS